MRNPRTGLTGPLVVGVDVGGTGIKALLADAGNRVLDERRVPTPRPGPGIAERVADAVQTCVADLVSSAPAAAVGLVVPGLVDEEKGVALGSENLGWRDVPLRDMLAERIGLPVAFGHDVRAGGLAEVELGAGRDYSSVVFLPLGTGIAGALYLDGKPCTAHGYAGEIGHTDVGHDEPCACGGTGCLEAIASAAAIARRYSTRARRPAAGSLEVLRLARDGDPLAQAVWQDALDALSLSLAWLASVLAPEAVILGGGLAEAGDELLLPLADRLAKRLSFQPQPRLVRAALGDRAAGLGSALMARRLLG